MKDIDLSFEFFDTGTDPQNPRSKNASEHIARRRLRKGLEGFLAN
jgi:hypothetical protein